MFHWNYSFFHPCRIWSRWWKITICTERSSIRSNVTKYLANYSLSTSHTHQPIPLRYIREWHQQLTTIARRKLPGTLDTYIIVSLPFKLSIAKSSSNSWANRDRQLLFNANVIHCIYYMVYITIQSLWTNDTMFWTFENLASLDGYENSIFYYTCAHWFAKVLSFFQI